MKIIINPDCKFSAIQNEFNTTFPFLKIDFFVQHPSIHSKTTKVFIKNSDECIGHYGQRLQNEYIEIWPHTTVKELVLLFNKVYSLSVQILRCSGTVWLETTVTDMWSLEKQNKEGEALSKKIN